MGSTKRIFNDIKLNIAGKGKKQIAIRTPKLYKISTQTPVYVYHDHQRGRDTSPEEYFNIPGINY